MKGGSPRAEPQQRQGSASPGNFCLRYFLVAGLSSPGNWDKGKELAGPQPRPGTRPGPVVNRCVPGLTVHSRQAGGGGRAWCSVFHLGCWLSRHSRATGTSFGASEVKSDCCCF